ncbi:hypothetical protein BHU61_11065 [Macrococcus epidermidis]|uniref:VWFA domain-containing protein n=1 Tax=Macrococcus epidermidis TaxID=1902580 RepID=A0A327ZS81_9STAP|nr:SpaA isopeptide-forming pilin-related protein [Macrococcus epidermidis]RAK43888.1 hypothetical protein BHU61_11065 [Macrococcus epidermidis]
MIINKKLYKFLNRKEGDIIKKFNSVFLIILLLNVLFTELFGGIASADTVTRSSDNSELLQVTAMNHTDSTIDWHITINSAKQQLSDKKVTLSLKGKQNLDLNALNTQLATYGAEVTQPDSARPDYIIVLKDDNQSLSFDLTTAIQDQNQTDYRLTLTHMNNGAAIEATDAVYQTFEIKGDVVFEQLPSDIAQPDSEVILVNADTQEKVMRVVVNPDGSYIFNDVRKFDDQGNEIKYEVTSSLTGNYKTTVDQHTITHTYLETTIKGIIDNPSNEPLELTLMNKTTGEKVDTLTVESSDTYQFENLPEKNDDGTPIEYEVSVKAIDGYKVSVSDYNITLQKEDAVTTESPATTSDGEANTKNSSEDPTTEDPTTEAATTETINSSDVASVDSVDTVTAQPVEDSVVAVDAAPTGVSAFAFPSLTIDSSNIQTLTTTTANSTFTTDSPIVHSTTGDKMTMNATLSPDGTKINWTITIGRNGSTTHTIQALLYNMVFSTGQTLDTSSFKMMLSNGSTTNLTYNTTYKSVEGIVSSLGQGANAGIISFSTTITNKSLSKYTLNIGGSSPAAQFIAKNITQNFTITGTLNLADTTPPNAPVVNAVNTTTTLLTGSAEAGSKITVILSNGTQLTGTTDSVGKFQISIPPQSTGSIITVNATDVAGNVSPNTQITVTDMLNTTIGTIYDNQTSVSGTASPNSIVTITNASGTVLGSTQADSNGRYYVELYRPQAAGTVIYAEAKSNTGIVSNKAQATVLSSAGVPTPGNGLPIVEPSPTYIGDVNNMTWDERGLYRNRVPQPVEYNEGFLWKATQPTSTPNKYSIDLKTQGRETGSQVPLDIVLVVDNSYSMNYVGTNGVSRWQNMKNSVNTFVDQITKSNTGSATDTRIGVVNFASNIVSQTGFQTNPTSIKSAIPSIYQTDVSPNTGTGHTFTQLGIRTGSQMLSTARATAKKIMIVLTDGAPTFSYKGTAATSPENITAFSTTRVGDGQLFPLSSTAGNFAYSIGSVSITNHGQPTISEAKIIRAAHPEYEIFSIGLETNNTINTDGATPTEMNNVLNNIASKQANAFLATDTAKDLPNILSNIAQTTIKSIASGTVTDPIGTMYDLDLGSNNGFDASDYTLTASNPALLNGVTVTYDAATRTIKINGLTLGKGEWVNINYNVTLRTSDPNFVDSQWYPMNGRTTLQPTPTSTVLRDYPIPEAKFSQPTYSFSFNKLSDTNQPLAGAVFTITDSTGKVVQATSSANGVVQFTNLSPGNYTLKEITAPQGYLLDSATHAVVVASNGDITVDGKLYTGTLLYQLINKSAVGSLEVKKYEAGNTAKVLSGATFELRDSTGKVVMTKTTDSTGVISFTNLPFGTYTLVETKAPAGYELDATPITVEINSTTVVKKDVANNKSMLPNTGGMGTVIFTVVGIGLILLAIWLKRKRH